MKSKLRYMAFALLALLLMSAGQKTVHTLGDSTMATYDESATVTRGWGMYLSQFLTNGWTSVNYAKGGRDSRVGYTELWATAKTKVQPGDYVIIQFAHNDEKNGGMDGYQLKAYYDSIGDATSAAAVDLRGTVPTTTYKEYLRKMVDEAEALGARPILVGPVCRSYFGSDGKIKRNGRHDLGDSYSLLTATGPTTGNQVASTDHTMDYVYQMKSLAEEKNIPFIDLTTATAELYESYGDAKCHELLFDGNGSTHFNTTGALLVARTCAKLMKQQGILNDSITLPSDISVNPSSADLGEAYKGQTLQKEFTLSGFGLSPESGSVSITSSDGMTLSTDKQTWSQNLNVSYQAATLIQTFYLQFTLNQPGETAGTITIMQGEKKITIPVKATAVSMEGGTDVQAYWRLEKDSTYTVSGPATVLGEQMQGMYVQRYSNPNAKTVWPTWTGFDSTRKMQRTLITGDQWPADEIDDNPSRYIQFGITPNAGNTLKIDSLGHFVCGCGGNGMMCHIYYSTDNFETRHTIYAPNNMVANNPEAVQAQPVVTLTEGQQLLIRIYPWYNGAASSKTYCISDVTIHGKAYDSSSTGVMNHGITNPNVVSRTYYDMNGRAVTAPQKGIVILHQQLADGSISTRKVNHN